jgi:predicted small secreted protein
MGTMTGDLVMKVIIKNIFLGVLVCGFAMLAGCDNTMSGFGKDMQQNGQKIQKSADS